MADAYGLDLAGRHELQRILSGSIVREFVRRRVGAGDPNSSRCGTTWAAWSASTAAADGAGHQQQFLTALR